MPPDPVAILRSRFGYPGFRPGQEEIVRAVIAGRDAVGVLPTGGGKSVCYQVPAIALGGVTLVVTPLVSLMEDQVGRARDAGLRAKHLSSTQPAAERRAVSERARRGDLDILFVAPERLDSAAFRATVEGIDVRLLAVDEAHCISEWGHDFRPSYRRIGAIRPLLSCPTLALTATATPAVRADIVASLGLPDPLVLIRSFDRPNLSWRVLPGGPPAERAASVHALLRRTPGCAVVYAPTRRAVETVRDLLAARGVRAEAYHAGLPGAERTRVQRAFMADECRVVVATNAFGMGIDKPDVRLVVHVQLSATLESYYQEAGRAGRDGAPADCVAFHARSDRRLGRAFIDRTHPRRRVLMRAHRLLRRAAGPDGVLRLDAPGLRNALGPDLDAWSTGEPAGVLGALERVGAVRRIGLEAAETAASSHGRAGGADRPASGNAAGHPEGVANGTETVPEGSEGVRVGVRRRLDVAAAAAQRRRALDKLCAVQRFARSPGCRRGALLRYFGEDAPDACGRCDRCSGASSS